MEPNEKISPGFRERLAALTEDETVCALVTLSSSLPEKPAARSRHHRKRLIASLGEQTADALAELSDTIESAGGKILSVSKPLSIMTIQADRRLIERLSESDSVKAIIENQPIDSIDTRDEL